MSIPFFINEPKILLNNNYILELYPTSNMDCNQKLNAISRLIILLSFIGLLLTRSIKFLVIGILTLIIIYILFKTKSNKITKENFQSLINNTDFQQNKIIDNNSLPTFLKEEYKLGNKKNPFSNVLLTDIGDYPERKSAPPSFNTDVYEDITRSTKKLVQGLNPEIKNTNKQLFSSLTDNFDLDQSNRIWYSMPNTQVVNNQGAFAEYLYDNLKYSGKESTAEGAIARVADSYRYTLY